MRDPVVLDWRVPRPVWKRFREYVQDQFGSLDGYLGREAEAAMKEYADADGYTGVEERVNQLVQAAGRTPEGASKEKTSDLSNKETTRVTARVDEVVKDEFRSVAKKGDATLGVAFARALDMYMDGGRAARLERKLDRVLDDATAVLEEMNPEESEGGLSSQQRKVITICNRLGEQFTEEELIAEIDDVAGRYEHASEPTRERYKEYVLDRLDVEPHPNAPKTVWVPSEYAAELVPDGTPRECRLPTELLDHDQQVRRIQLVAGRRAAERSTGRVRVNTADVHEDVLEREVSKSTVLTLMEEAALTPGYHLDRERETASLRVNLKKMKETDPDLFREIIEYRDGEADELLSGTTESTVTDFTDGPSATDVNDRMDALSNAVTDGGGPSRDETS